MIGILVISNIEMNWNSAEDGEGAQTQQGGNSSSAAEWSPSCFEVADGVVTGLSDEGEVVLAQKQGVLVFPADLNADAIMGQSETEKGAFQDRSDIVSVDFSQNNYIKSIGNSAFSGNSSLTTLKLSDSVTNIGQGAFRNCEINHEIAIGENMVSIGDYALSGNRITAVIFPENFKSSTVRMGRYIFSDNHIRSVNLGNLGNVHGLASSAWTTVFTGCLSEGMFHNNRIEELDLPEEGMWGIGEHAFSNNRLTSLTIPKNIKNLYRHSFQDNANLGSLEIRYEGIQIDRASFQGCAIKTENLTLPRSINQWGGYTFKNNQLQGTIVLPEFTVTMGYQSFAGNRGLTKVVLNDTMQFDDTALALIPDLKHVEFRGEIKSKTFNPQLFWGGSLKSLDIPDYIENFGGRVFGKNSGWHPKSKAVALYRKNAAGYVMDNPYDDSIADGYLFNPVLLQIRYLNQSGEILSTGETEFTIRRMEKGTQKEYTQKVGDEDYLHFKLGDVIRFKPSTKESLEFVSANGNHLMYDSSSDMYTVELSPENVEHAEYEEGYETGYKKYVLTLNYKDNTPATTTTEPSESEPSESEIEETTSAAQSTTSTAQSTTSTAQATTPPDMISTPSVVQSSGSSTEDATEISSHTLESASNPDSTTESVTQSAATTVFSPEETVTSTTRATTRRTLEFVEIFEDIPLGVQTTAPLDLELLISVDEDIPLGGIVYQSDQYGVVQLPSTGNFQGEVFIGIGILAVSIAVMVMKRMD